MSFLIAGIGASAGGLEAVTELLRGLPKSTGIAYIVVQHLDPHHESQLSEILATKTALPVSAALAGELVQADHVYVIPPGATLTVQDGHIDLKPRSNGRSFPVDLLFRSLADTYADRAIGIVLSGSDADGSLGIREIKHVGGYTFAQRPETTRFATMPSHAIDTGCVDLVMRPSEITDELVRLGRRFKADPARESRSSVELIAGAEGEEALLRHLFRRLRAAHGVDFTHYKRTTIRRRIERRMTLRRVESLEDYAALIDSDPGELAALYQDFLIRVTEFFRDTDLFQALSRYVFPVVCEGRSESDPIRIWVPGCATGEEAYSVAIAALEYVHQSKGSCGIQIFGTDVSEAALRVARAGVYAPNLVQEISEDRLQRYFTQDEGGYRIAREVRDLCLFAHQDLTRDPPFSKVDLISCRNLLIYLDDVIQRRILRTFHFALRPHGMLFLGRAESVGQSELFEPVDKQSRLFQRTPNTGGGSLVQGTRTSEPRPFEPAMYDVLMNGDGDSLLREADRLLLARFSPAALLVNQSLTVLQFRGPTGAYLQPAGGPPSLDLRRVVRPELLVDILPAIEEARSSHSASRRGVPTSDGREISMEVVPLVGSTGAPSFLILFDDRLHAAPAGHVSVASAVTLPESEKDRRLAQLEREVEGLRNYMRAATEEHGAVQEELRSAHEEVLSANEEYQSANEELESSKEELQSTNEELMSTIEELRTRNQELAVLNAELVSARNSSDRARAYADIIIETVRQPLVVLDAEQRILRINPAFLENMELAREDAEGKFLHEIDAGRWNIPALREKLNELRTRAEPLEDMEVTVDLARRQRRVLSLSARTIPGDAERAQLFLLAFEDVTIRANVAAGLHADSERKDEFLATLGHELRHPLTPITHSTFLLRQRTSDPASLELLEAIEAQTKRLTRFVNELLDVARIGRGLIEIRRSRVDLVVVVRESVRALAPLIEERQHVLSLVLPSSPIYVNGDSDRLDQVITNLVENAAKYTDPGGKITVSLERGGKNAVLSVRDSGIGIATENLELIFAPYTQSRGVLADPRSGLGLGLGVARRIVELHRGSIRATSGGPAKGSEFVASIPALDADEGHDAKSESIATAHPQVRTRKILVVDDHDSIRVSLTRLFKSWGHEVAVAEDGPSALERARSFKPEYAMIDITLPGMSGIDVAQRLRETFSPAQLFLIALTGRGGAEMRANCLAAGFDTFMVKPGDIAELRELLSRDYAQRA